MLLRSELTAVSDDDLLLGGAGLGADGSHSLDDLNAGSDLAEDAVLTIEVGEGVEGNEELRSVGVLASIGHGEETTTDVLVDEVLVLELGTIDGLSTSAVEVGEVTTLGHEAGDNSVEGDTLVVKRLARLADSLLTSAESSEVLRGLGSVGGEVEGDAASGGSTNGDIEENGGVRGVVWLSHSFFFYLSQLLRRGVY